MVNSESVILNNPGAAWNAIVRMIVQIYDCYDNAFCFIGDREELSVARDAWRDEFCMNHVVPNTGLGTFPISDYFYGITEPSVVSYYYYYYFWVCCLRPRVRSGGQD